MGTITGTSIINKASTQLIDPSNTRWTRAELLGWLNDAQRQIVVMQPAWNNKVVAVKLAAGTRQTIPSDGWMLLDIYRNMGTTGTTPGTVVRIVSRRLIDRVNPAWHTVTATNTAQNYIYTLEDKEAYYVYPPADGTGYLELNYSQLPTDLATEGQTIDIDDVLESAILNYVLAMANAKDGEYAPGLALAQIYMTAFMGAVAEQEKSETDSNISNTLFGRNPGVRGSES